MPSPKPHLKCDKCGKASYTKRCAKCMTADNKKAEESKKKKEKKKKKNKGKKKKEKKKKSMNK